MACSRRRSLYRQRPRRARRPVAGLSPLGVRPAPPGALLVATRSEGKLRELLPLLEVHGWSACTLPMLGVPETAAEDELEAFDTFEGNAVAKARYFASITGWPVLADDSGLMVDALHGRPGVHSKRWSGRSDLSGAALDAENNALLQRALDDAATRGREERSARYVCVMAAAFGAEIRQARGETAGVLLREPRGSDGFGYDPYFFSLDLGRTFAEVPRDAKAAVSHRGRALRALLTDVARCPPVDPGARRG